MSWIQLKLGPTPTPIAPDTMLYNCRARCRTFGPPSPRGAHILFGHSTNVAWLNSSTTATIVQTAHHLQLDSTTYKTTLSTMTTYPHLLRSLSQTPTHQESPLSDTVLSDHPDSPLLTQDEEWENYRPDDRKTIIENLLLCREHEGDQARIRDWQRENVSDSSEDEFVEMAQGTPVKLLGEATPIRVLGGPSRRLFKNPNPPTCRCGLFQPCQECRMFLTKESLEMGVKTHSKSQTTSEAESWPDSDCPASDLDLENRDGRPDISSLLPLKVVSTGRINNLLIFAKRLVQSTEYHENSMLMEDIIFTLSSTSNENSNSRTVIDSAWENDQETRVQSARLKLIVTYYQLRAHPSTLGTMLESTEISSPTTARDHALADLTQLETTCGQAAWLLQTKKSFLKTCKSILRETLFCSTNRSQRTPGESTQTHSLRCPPLKKTASSFIGSGIRKPGHGSSRISATQSMQFARLREESPTLLRQKRKTGNGSNYIDLTESDPDDLSPSSYTGTRD